MRSARIALLGLSIALLGACGVPDVTTPETTPPRTESTDGCGYLGSAGCAVVPDSNR